MKETRNLKIMFSKSGSGSSSARIALPTNWMKKMSLKENDRCVEVTFNDEDNTITIKKNLI